MTDKDLAAGFQVTSENPMLGIDSRAGLLRSLGGSLLEHQDVFGEQGRPGNLVGKIAPWEIMEIILALTRDRPHDRDRRRPNGV